MAAMKWGVSLAQAGELADPTTVADLAKQAEDAGWDGMFVWDHLWHRTGAPLADPWVTLAAIAAATQRVAIGTLVCALPRRRPQLVAQAATTLDRLSGARMVLGLGLGVDSYGEFSTFGEPAADDRGRGAALDAGIDLLLPMLAGDPVPAAGGRVTTAPSARRPRLPVWVAGTLGHRAGRAGSPGSGWRASAWSAPASGRRSTWPQPSTPAVWHRVRSTSCSPVASTPTRRRSPPTGATWCVPELRPGTSAADALTLIDAGPGAR